jgi:hypothetical protein
VYLGFLCGSTGYCVFTAQKVKKPYVTYITYLNNMGILDSDKYVCILDENLVSVGLTSLLRNGSPFLSRLNILTRRSLEGGLLCRYWVKLIWITNLRSKMRVVDDEKDLYFVFSLSHLKPAFCVLAFDFVLSSVAFLAEVFVKSIPKLHKSGLV